MPLLVSWDNGNSHVTHDKFTVGRDKADLIVDDEYASSPHCVIGPDGGSWVLRDLGSTNGTYVNGGFEREYGPYVLARGDKVRIGRTVLTVVPF